MFPTSAPRLSQGLRPSPMAPRNCLHLSEFEPETSWGAHPRAPGQPPGNRRRLFTKSTIEKALGAFEGEEEFTSLTLEDMDKLLLAARLCCH
uniref:Uncharacterized protein n=1 Tax=Salix viminalis TaxID=40686 RepID=A0A6N2LW27_SALVM